MSIGASTPTWAAGRVAKAGRRPMGFGRAPVVLGAAFALVAWWVFLAPPALGGRTSYVITDGVSMLPRFHAGDLVILRKDKSYHVGEVAAYHNLQLGVVVMHRIIGKRDGHYEFKGDNNNFVDQFQPTKAEIVGAEWADIGGVGKYVQKLRDPVVAAIALGILWLASFAPRRASRRQKRRRRHAH